MRKIELLSPARDAEVGIEAFNHGADAVYIGSPAFGARTAASNSVADIERLAAYGHQYFAKTIVAFNTIVGDQELEKARTLAWQLYEAGVDALIIQDLGLLKLDLPPIELHASTQTDNRTIDKVRLLKSMGMSRVVLARELPIEQIRRIHEAVDVELECFVHGALCVSYSGQCYMSAFLNGRSANRGQCAQPCRLPIDMIDPVSGRVLIEQKHLLSLRDMNRSALLRELVEAGVSSFKIEGRLKDAAYVKNVTAYYRRMLDDILSDRDSLSDTDICRVSEGTSVYTFTPDPSKSFNRGFTTYFAEGDRNVASVVAEPMWNFETPKSVGERIGVVSEVGRDYFCLREKVKFNNGDGLAVEGNGFRLNRYDQSTGRCYPLDGAKVCRQIRKGSVVFRNLDYQFEQLLSRPSAKRRMAVNMRFRASSDALSLELDGIRDCHATVVVQGAFEPAQKPQSEQYERQLIKTGDTAFSVQHVDLSWDQDMAPFGYFVPASVLSDLRRRACDALMKEIAAREAEARSSYHAPDYSQLIASLDAQGILPSDYRANVLNHQAREVYSQMGISPVDDAFEQSMPRDSAVMFTRHCLKFSMGQCPRFTNTNPSALLPKDVRLKESVVLKVGGKRFILKFGCQNDCISKIIPIFAANFTK